MTNEITLFQRTRTGKIQQWTIWIVSDGDSGHPEVWTEFGQTDGKKQTTFDIISVGVNIGRSNETTPLEQAILSLERKAIKQREKGYRDVIDDVIRDISIDFLAPMPKELCFYKPKNSIDDKKIDALEAALRTVYTVKRDGMMHIVRKSNTFGVEIYSRRMDLVTDKYPHLVKSLRDVPHEFILLGEFILDIDGVDDFAAIISICRSDPEKSLARQAVLGQIHCYVFDIAFLGDGKNSPENLLTTAAYIDRLDIFDKYIQSHLSSDSSISRCEILNYDNDKSAPLSECRNKMTHVEALKIVADRELEGLVVWDAQGVMASGSEFTFNGKAYRPNVVWKRKPKYEDDFIVRWDPDQGIGTYGTGKNCQNFKSVLCSQLDSNGEEVGLGNCGGGFSDKLRLRYTDPSLFPRVWRIEYDSIQPGTGALRYAEFKVDRTDMGDKLIEECLMSDSVKKARGEEDE